MPNANPRKSQNEAHRRLGFDHFSQGGKPVVYFDITVNFQTLRTVENKDVSELRADSPLVLCSPKQKALQIHLHDVSIFLNLLLLNMSREARAKPFRIKKEKVDRWVRGVPLRCPRLG